MSTSSYFNVMVFSVTASCYTAYVYWSSGRSMYVTRAAIRYLGSACTALGLGPPSLSYPPTIPMAHRSSPGKNFLSYTVTVRTVTTRKLRQGCSWTKNRPRHSTLNNLFLPWCHSHYLICGYYWLSHIKHSWLWIWKKDPMQKSIKWGWVTCKIHTSFSKDLVGFNYLTTSTLPYAK